MKNVLLYCRQGFEKDCAAEISDLANQEGFYGYAKVTENSGFVLYVMDQDDAGERLIEGLDFNNLIFARQISHNTFVAKGFLGATVHKC